MSISYFIPFLKALDGVFSALVRHQTSVTQAPSEDEKTTHSTPGFHTVSSPSNDALSRHVPPKIDMARPVSVISVAKTVVDDSLERGLLTKETALSGLGSRFVRLVWGYKFWILIGTVGALCV